MRIALIPLDERPVNTRYPRMLAHIAGAEVVLPPYDMLSKLKTPADSPALLRWLYAQASQVDGMVISCETLGYGSLIHSRISHETAITVLTRLEMLRTLKQQHPALKIYGFNLITRIGRSNDHTEEPEYWGTYGAKLYRMSQLLDEAEHGHEVSADLDALTAQIPAEHIDDFLRRRLRNHTVNLGILGLAADGIFDLLVISSDDTSPYGLGTREKRWVTEWVKRLNLENRLLLYPGADEVGSILVARLLNQMAGKTPKFQVEYLVPGGDAITAAFEDSAVRVTVERQILAAGAVIVPTDGEVILMVNPPRSSSHDFPVPYTDEELRDRAPLMQNAAHRILRYANAGKSVALGDVGTANGGDNVLMNALREQNGLLKLAAYGGWNTAGNTLGTTIAHACLITHAGYHGEASRRFLVHHLLEDWAYQANVRQEVTSDTPEATKAWLAERLMQWANELNGGFQLVPDSLNLPWQRLFEVDFDLI